MHDLALLLAATLLLCLTVDRARAAHPQVYVGSTDRQAMQRKLEQVEWAKQASAKLRERLDPYVQRHQQDPEWITSRMLMNWDTHYITPVVENDKWVRGEGRAPVPTPRYAGGRDWAAEYGLPGLEELKPYNSKDGDLWARNKDGKYAWVHPSKTGHSIESRNRQIMGLAREAAFVYWLTGQEAYAKFAADILWLYVYGFSFKTMPKGPNGKLVGEEGGPRHIYGSQTFEVIHDGIVKDIAVAYDFLHDYLRQQGKDVKLIQLQLKRMADRVIDGGGREGNWNLHQADTIAHAGLALEDDSAYGDGKGRQHYVDVVLNADTPHQLGLRQVLREGYDQETGIWPEAFGYGTGVTVSITRIASLIGRQPEGAAILNDPILTKAALVQFQWLYPNGRSLGLGDTTHAHAPTAPLELLIAFARANGLAEREHTLTGALRQEMDAGRYQRGSGTGLTELCLYVPELAETEGDAGFEYQRVFHGKPLNALIQRNLAADPAHSLMVALYGTRGGHTHANGLALELFGAGEIQAPDPGPGSSYWQPDHGRYYKQRPAHNTVIVDGNSSGDCEMEVLACEPSPGQQCVSANFGFAEASLSQDRPAAEQRRCVALVRTSPTTGFCLDVFRSRADSPEHQSHDYVYHNLGNTIQLLDAEGNALGLSQSAELGSKHGDQAGYDYFTDERSAEVADTFRAVFATKFPDREVGNAVWMIGASDRRVYALSSPKIIRANRGELPGEVAALPLPTLLVRQKREAWDEPFVVVFDPFDAVEGPSVQSVQRIAGTQGSAVVLTVEGATPTPGGTHPYTVALAHDESGDHTHALPGGSFKGQFGGFMLRDGQLAELYLGRGREVTWGQTRLLATGGEPTAASLRPTANGWEYAAAGPVQVALPAKAVGADAPALHVETNDQRQRVIGAELIRKGATLVVRASLPSGRGRLTLGTR